MLGLSNIASSYRTVPKDALTKQSVSLDGTNDHIIITDSLADDIKNVGSMSIWLKLETANQNDTIMNLHTDTSNDNKIAILFINQGGSELIRVNCRGGSSNTILDHSYSASDSVSNGWTHFVCSWDRENNTIGIYLNGTKVAASTSSITSFATTANKIYIGKPGNADNAFFQGHFSNLALFGNVLTDVQATELYNGGKPLAMLEGDIKERMNLRAWLPLDEASGNFIDRLDRLENGANGVPTNSPTQGTTDVP